jgi:hypothetical protein
MHSAAPPCSFDASASSSSIDEAALRFEPREDELAAESIGLAFAGLPRLRFGAGLTVSADFLREFNFLDPPCLSSSS